MPEAPSLKDTNIRASPCEFECTGDSDDSAAHNRHIGFSEIRIHPRKIRPQRGQVLCCQVNPVWVFWSFLGRLPKRVWILSNSSLLKKAWETR